MNASPWYKPTRGVWVFMTVVAVVVGVVWWNSRVTEVYELMWWDSTYDARIHLNKPGGDELLGTAFSADGALEILARKGWRPVTSRREGDKVVYLLSRTGLKSKGYITVTPRTTGAGLKPDR